MFSHLDPNTSLWLLPGLDGCLERLDPINQLVMPNPDSDSCKLWEKLNQKLMAVGSIMLGRGYCFKLFLNKKLTWEL